MIAVLSDYYCRSLQLATFFIDRDAENDDAELASAKSIKALQTEITLSTLVEYQNPPVSASPLLEPKQSKSFPSRRARDYLDSHQTEILIRF